MAVTSNLRELGDSKNNQLIQYNTIITQKENELTVLKEERLMLIGELRLLNQMLQSVPASPEQVNTPAPPVPIHEDTVRPN
jgi:hypothetical protein